MTFTLDAEIVLEKFSTFLLLFRKEGQRRKKRTKDRQAIGDVTKITP